MTACRGAPQLAEPIFPLLVDCRISQSYPSRVLREHVATEIRRTRNSKMPNFDTRHHFELGKWTTQSFGPWCCCTSQWTVPRVGFHCCPFHSPQVLKGHYGSQIFRCKLFVANTCGNVSSVWCRSVEPNDAKELNNLAALSQCKLEHMYSVC